MLAMVETESVSVAAFWGNSAIRAYGHALDWALQQGIVLTLLIAISSILFELLMVAIRHRHGGTINGWLRYARETLLALSGGCLVAAFSIVFWFFIQDAPQQLDKAHQQVLSLTADVPAGPKRGPVGPILAVELSQGFAKIRPCKLYFTSAPDNENLRETLRWVAQYGGGCYPLVKAEVLPILDADNPSPPQNAKPGVVVHWNEGLAPGMQVIRLLTNFAVSASHLTFNKKSDVIWIDIGPGNPWKN